MKAIEGIDLVQELECVRAERLTAQTADVRKAINGIYNDLHSWKKQREDFGKQAEKLSEKIMKAEGKLERLKSGDWSVLNEEKPEGQPNNSPKSA